MNKRFFEYLRFKNVSQRSLSKLSGIAPSIISRFCAGNSISSDKLLRLLQVCDDLSLEWFFYGTGEMIRSCGNNTNIFNNGRYAGADFARDGGVIVKGSEKVLVSSPGTVPGDRDFKDDIISLRDKTISERDSVIAAKDAYILELLGKLK